MDGWGFFSVFIKDKELEITLTII